MTCLSTKCQRGPSRGHQSHLTDVQLAGRVCVPSSQTYMFHNRWPLRFCHCLLHSIEVTDTCLFHTVPPRYSHWCARAPAYPKLGQLKLLLKLTSLPLAFSPFLIPPPPWRPPLVARGLQTFLLSFLFTFFVLSLFFLLTPCVKKKKKQNEFEPTFRYQKPLHRNPSFEKSENPGCSLPAWNRPSGPGKQLALGDWGTCSSRAVTSVLPTPVSPTLILSTSHHLPYTLSFLSVEKFLCTRFCQKLANES